VDIQSAEAGGIGEWAPGAGAVDTATLIDTEAR
jgi:hypothetical protein